MVSSIKQWHKSVLFASVALLACGGTAMAQPADYTSEVEYVLNVFTATENGFLDGIGLWDVDDEIFRVQIYDSFNLTENTFGTNLAQNNGGSTTPGEEYIEVLFGSKVSLTAGQTYAVLVRAILDKNHGVSFDSPEDNKSYYRIGSTWYDLYDSYSGLTFAGGSTPARANFVMDLLTSSLPNITAAALEGTWSINSQAFTGPNTLDMNLTAGEMKPFVTEIEVSSDMANITITEEVLNNITERDWTGYGFQLGFWDAVNEQFISSVNGDGLAFTIDQDSDVFINFTVLSQDHIQFGNGLVKPGESVTFALAIGLPGGLDSYTFAIRQYAIPEPSSFLLLAISGVILLCSRRRR